MYNWQTKMLVWGVVPFASWSTALSFNKNNSMLLLIYFHGMTCATNQTNSMWLPTLLLCCPPLRFKWTLVFLLRRLSQVGHKPQMLYSSINLRFCFWKCILVCQNILIPKKYVLLFLLFGCLFKVSFRDLNICTKPLAQ